MDKKEMIPIDIYCDTTGLFSDGFCNNQNCATILIEKEYLYQYFLERIAEEYRTEDKEDMDNRELFKEWLSEYDCDSTIDLYSWGEENSIKVVIDCIY